MTTEAKCVNCDHERSKHVASIKSAECASWQNMAGFPIQCSCKTYQPPQETAGPNEYGECCVMPKQSVAHEEQFGGHKFKPKHQETADKWCECLSPAKVIERCGMCGKPPKPTEPLANEVCPKCGGSGRLTSNPKYICDDCNGTGFIPTQAEGPYHVEVDDHSDDCGTVYALRGPNVGILDKDEDLLKERAADFNLGFERGVISTQATIESEYKRGIFETEQIHKHAIEQFPVLTATIEKLEQFLVDAGDKITVLEAEKLKLETFLADTSKTVSMWCPCGNENNKNIKICEWHKGYKASLKT